MVLPDGFTSAKHFRQVAMQSYNKIVREAFKDIDEDLPDSINTPRASLRTACSVAANDSTVLIASRMMLFYFTLRQAADLQAPIYGIPVGQFHETRRYKPQVCLYFREPLDEVDPDFQPLRAEIKFRLMNETTESISKAKLTTLANKIKSEFGAANGYKWRKGKILCSYNDPEKGYKLQIYAFSATEGKSIINKVLDCQNHSPDWERLTINENDQPSAAYPTLPPNKTIAGQIVRLPRRRPVGNVRFVKATCAIWGLTKPITLIDRSLMSLDALVEP
jgi:hypothetical protein